MRYLKKLIKLMGVVGFMVILGAVGHADYNDAIGEYVSFNELFLTILTGVALMTPAITMLICGGNCGK